MFFRAVVTLCLQRDLSTAIAKSNPKSQLFMVYYSWNLLGSLVGPNKSIRTVKANWVSLAVTGLKKKDWGSSVWNPGRQGISWDFWEDAVPHSFLGNVSSLNIYFLQESKFKKNFITCKCQPTSNREMSIGFTCKQAEVTLQASFGFKKNICRAASICSDSNENRIPL